MGLGGEGAGSLGSAAGGVEMGKVGAGVRETVEYGERESWPGGRISRAFCVGKWDGRKVAGREVCWGFVGEKGRGVGNPRIETAGRGGKVGREMEQVGRAGKSQKKKDPGRGSFQAGAEGFGGDALGGEHELVLGGDVLRVIFGVEVLGVEEDLEAGFV